MRVAEQRVVEFVDSCFEPEPDRHRVLQYLIAIQHEFGFIPPAAVDALRAQLDVSIAEINGLVSFYSFLEFAPAGRYRILISDNITDRFHNNQQIYQKLLALSTDLPVSIGYTSCIGLPDQPLGMLVNGIAVSNVDELRASKIHKMISDQIPVSRWPGEFFHISDNIQRRDRQLQTSIAPGEVIKQVNDKGVDWCLDELDASMLRGRGGAGFPASRKWRLCRDVKAEQHVVVCNADEGEPGTFKDRVLLNSDADSIIEGMTVCARVIGAQSGFIYLRGEYRYLLEPLQAVIQRRREQGLLGSQISGINGFDFDIEIHLGAGAYICGEESALIESLEGRRGVPRVRPPFPVQQGYLGRPTVVNNVETFWSVSRIIKQGADWFKQAGTEQSPGTRLISISGDCQRPGVYEYPFGTSITQILEDCAGQSAQAVQVSGAAGNMVLQQHFDRQLSFEDLPTGGSFMVIGAERNIIDVLDNFAGFFRHESCGFCTPCRNGTDRLADFICQLKEGRATHADKNRVERMLKLMTKSSFCGLGCSAPTAFLDVLRDAPQLFNELLRSGDDNPAFDLNAAVSDFTQFVAEQKTEAQSDA